MSRRRPALVLLMGLVVVGGCGPKAYVRTGFTEQPPQRVAVLPFVITYAYDVADGALEPASHELGRDTFRTTFYHAFATYGYEDLTLPEVDEQLTAAWGPVHDGGWRTASPQMLGKTLGVDALIYGEISRLMHFSTPLYTETSLTATLKMVDARSGEKLWSQKVSVAERGGALLQQGQVVDFLKDQARSFKPGVKFTRVADVAVRKALKGMPNPPMAAEAGASRPAHRKTIRLAILPLMPKHEKWQKAAGFLRTSLATNLQKSPLAVSSF